MEQEVMFKIETTEGLLEEVLFILNQLPNQKINSYWFKNTYELCSEISKRINKQE